MNNSVFGKTMEDVRNRENMHLTIDRDNAIKWFSKIESKHANFIDGLYLIQTHKTATMYDKPFYVGCSILDVSKGAFALVCGVFLVGILNRLLQKNMFERRRVFLR